LFCIITVTNNSQVPVTIDHDPKTQNDSFVVALDRQSSLNVLANDAAAFGTLEVTSTTASNYGVALRCPNNSCILYTPSSRFSGFDQVSYTAQDLRGRTVPGTTFIRLQTAAPKLLGMPKHADILQATSFPVFSGSSIAYEDAVWQLTANVSVDLDMHAGPSDQWPVGLLSLGGLASGTAAGVSTLATQSKISVVPAGRNTVSTSLSGNRTTLGLALKELLLTPPATYSGGALVQLQLCSLWMECSVSFLPFKPSNSFH
jgi:hypothetical protein